VYEMWGTEPVFRTVLPGWIFAGTSRGNLAYISEPQVTH